MSKKLALKTETLRVLSSTEIEQVDGGAGSVFRWTGPINNPFETSVHGPVSSAKPEPAHKPVHHHNPIKNPFETHVSSVRR